MLYELHVDQNLLQRPSMSFIVGLVTCNNVNEGGNLAGRREGLGGGARCPLHREDLTVQDAEALSGTVRRALSSAGFTNLHLPAWYLGILSQPPWVEPWQT